MIPFLESASISGNGFLDIDDAGRIIISTDEGTFDFAYLLHNFLGAHVRFEVKTQDINLIPRGVDLI